MEDLMFNFKSTPIKRYSINLVMQFMNTPQSVTKIIELQAHDQKEAMRTALEKVEHLLLDRFIIFADNKFWKTDKLINYNVNDLKEV